MDSENQSKRNLLIVGMVLLFFFICIGSLSVAAGVGYFFFMQDRGSARTVQISVQNQRVLESPNALSTEKTTQLPTNVGVAERSMPHVESVIPTRDLRDLALRLRPGVDNIPQIVPHPEYEVGDRIQFWAANVDNNEHFQIEAELFYKNDVVYAWVETGHSVDMDALIEALENFSSKSYPLVREFFGTEWNPGIDAASRVHILHATNLGRGIAGYYSSSDEFSALANEFSNQKEMFYISLDFLQDIDDYEYYETVLAHEFQHMVHWYNDRNEEAWVNEGLSELAKDIAGYPPDMGVGVMYANTPDTQLNTWSDSPAGNGEHYDSAYLFMAYFLQRFGEALTRAMVAQAANGIAGFTITLQEAGLDITFEDLFADWVIANYVNDYDALGTEGIYGYQKLRLQKPVAERSYDRYPVETHQTSVHNFGVDYIILQGGGDVVIDFQGDTITRFANVVPYSGAFAWWSNRADDSDARLTRLFDFSDVRSGDELTMDVRMWYDIEDDYDYGYVLASRDGCKWDVLPGQRTTAQNPSGNSFGHAYTAESTTAIDSTTPQWLLESFDLRAYAGQEVWVRFEYVTDDAVNYPGWFIDDVSIPAIGYWADFEAGADGWESEGWLLTDNWLSQKWLVQALAFHDGELVSVERVTVGEDGTAHIEVNGLGQGNEAVLVISGLTPVTTEEALYEYRITPVQRD